MAPEVDTQQLETQLEEAWQRLLSAQGKEYALKVLLRIVPDFQSRASQTSTSDFDKLTSLSSEPALSETLSETCSEPARVKKEESGPISPHAKPPVYGVHLTKHHLARSSGQPAVMATHAKWRRALEAAQRAVDPWASRALHTLPMERCIRYRFNAHKRHWVTDDVLVKMEPKPFAAGAMRECHAVKKLSTFSGTVFRDWRKAQNCVAKRYKKAASAATYFNDVLVQQEAKAMGEEYNRTNPPKKVDMMQAALLVFPDRQGAPTFAVEQLIEGDYVKYNSNSGFVQGDELLRFTPQAFSHFTWHSSKGQRICVDIQGVGDLYTDPQIHTLDGEGFGDGNLGLRGMAYFFRTHQCNPLCARLGLHPFDRCDSDIRSQGYSASNSLVAGTAIAPRLSNRSVLRQSSSLRARLRSFLKLPSKGTSSTALSCDALLELLRDVPDVEAPEALVHMEVSRLYAEAVILPDIRPDQDPHDALQGAVFHLNQAASRGCVTALVLLARIHTGLDSCDTTFEYLVKAAKKEGELEVHGVLGWRAAYLAAQRGIAGAATAVAHAFATAQGVASGVLSSPEPGNAVEWYRRALQLQDELSGVRSELQQQLADEEGQSPRASMSAGGAAAAAVGGLFKHLRLSGPIVEETDSAVASAAVSPSNSQPATPKAGSLIRQGTDMTDASGENVAIVAAHVPPPRSAPSRVFLHKLRLAAEEEAAGLPFASMQRYEIHAALGQLLLDGGADLDPDYMAAAEHFNAAAEEASGLGKGKLAQKYYELAAQAESM